MVVAWWKAWAHCKMISQLSSQLTDPTSYYQDLMASLQPAIRARWINEPCTWPCDTAVILEQTTHIRTEATKPTGSNHYKNSRTYLHFFMLPLYFLISKFKWLLFVPQWHESYFQWNFNYFTTLLFLSASNEMSPSGDHTFFFCAICATAADVFNQLLSWSIILHWYTF